ncbi:MAG: hypothetical protein K6E32_11475 [Lachnospiraceae bacterium]|nr:hypothetical protein [Lachnospiraceae bacterium]
MPKRNDHIDVSRILFYGMTALYFCLLWYLFYSELAVYPTDPNYRFESDTYVHVKFALHDGFFHSLSAFVYLALSKLPFVNYTVSALLALITAGTVILTERLIRILPGAEDMPSWMVYITSFAFNLVMGFYVPFINKQHYIGYENANMWHNSTYIFMRFFAVLTVYYFILLYKKPREFSARTWILFTLSMLLGTAFKASFFTVFAPFLAVVLLIDLVTKRLPFKRVFVIALSVLPSLIVMALQSAVLFNSVEKTSIVISPFTTFSQRGDHPKVTLVLSVLFLISVFVFNLKNVFKDRAYGLSVLFYAIGFLEAFLFAESGARSLDSNFMWGYSSALFFAFIFAFVRGYKSFKEGCAPKWLFLIQCLILSWHAVSGVWHFVLLLQGFTYFA